MEEHPVAELSLSQLVYALEGRLNVIMMGRPCPDPILHWPVNAQAVVYLDKTSLAPINCLPPEILALIPTFRESEKVLINATAVCKYWRRTLVSTPSLWNKIVYLGRNITNPYAYFQRSRSPFTYAHMPPNSLFPT
ncbi:hypothetical protein BJ322DRAFT_207313 [Thelephora terrestris]|uniref:F-box domain-containing protein n=1 Tax=Thelephora terrestris TaxID=56493 RepID=A0A9P6L3X1_9AGAM|nr:hypothetical protein BJ322DRAFT_207313 [Thelephora terrestris]